MSYEFSITWNRGTDLFSKSLNFFDEIRQVVTTDDITKYADLNSSNSRTLQVYSVEYYDLTHLILTTRLAPSLSQVHSLVLISKTEGGLAIVGKIPLEEYIDTIYELVIKFEIPKNGSKYANINTYSKKLESTGEELIISDEHHHSMVWGKNADTYDRVPQSSATEYYYVSASLAKTSEDSNLYKYVYGETGTEGTGVVDKQGIRTDLGNCTRLIEPGSLRLSLANMLEEYFMAYNSIQILGKALPELSSTKIPDTNSILTVNTVEQTDSRKLSAISLETFRKYLLTADTQTISTPRSTLTVDSCVGVYNYTSTSSVPTTITITFKHKYHTIWVYNNSTAVNSKITLTSAGMTSDVVVSPGQVGVISKQGDEFTTFTPTISTLSELRIV